MRKQPPNKALETDRNARFAFVLTAQLGPLSGLTVVSAVSTN